MNQKLAAFKFEISQQSFGGIMLDLADANKEFINANKQIQSKVKQEEELQL